MGLFGSIFSVRAEASWTDKTPALRFDKHYDLHREPSFWNRPKVGRSYPTSGATDPCPDTVASPVFLSGATYLIFLGAPHVNGYEVIYRADDLWLDYFRHRIADPTYELDVHNCTMPHPEPVEG